MSDDLEELEAFKKRKYQYMAKDREGRDVFLAIRIMCFRWHRWISKILGSTLRASSDSLYEINWVKTVGGLQNSATCPPFVLFLTI